MSETKKPGFWGRLFGADKPQEPSETLEALERATEDKPGETEALDALREERGSQEKPDSRDAAPPEMQAEWLDAGRPNPPEPEPPTPEDVTDPLDRPDAIEDALTTDPEAPAEPEKPQGWLQRLSSGLKRSSDNLSNSIGAILTKRKLDDATLQDLEDTLIAADLGIDTAMAITERLRDDKFDTDISTEDGREALAA